MPPYDDDDPQALCVCGCGRKEAAALHLLACLSSSSMLRKCQEERKARDGGRELEQVRCEARGQC
eukprot:3045314-Rhodomonas_salina.1